MDINIIYEDSYIMVVEKPPKIPSQRDKTGNIDMLSLIKNYLKEKYPRAKNPYIGLIHRLDRPVGGLMVFAKTKQANAKLSKQIQDREFKKEYLVVICGKPEQEKGELVDYLIKNQRRNISKVVSKETKGAKEAILEYELVDSMNVEEEILSLIKVNLKTGRHHQIRVQLSNAGLPIWGDTKYNDFFKNKKGWFQIALWAFRLDFFHPKTNKLCSFKLNPKGYPFELFNIEKYFI
ncbi:RluA family pseudouridine synthase [Defluviitalea phaphyphila]|uniref:RluA family pseudouridine synthase n=1 Tax=Defluviitalea phaphyphila TaxID=1473580 RepID=UPI0007319FDC|nr:RluA family pseudouridine synthase [Defluviitalea phaphyphila]